MKIKSLHIVIIGILMLILGGISSTIILAQSMDYPILISIKPVNEIVSPGQKSALIVTFKIPRGYWLGSSDPSTRNPSATVIKMEPKDKFQFSRPIFPKPVASGVPVHKGYTYIHQGEINVVVPFSVKENLPGGEYKITAKITYTPGLNAGQLITHINEAYSTTVKVVPNARVAQTTLPGPSVRQVPQNFLVKEEVVNLSQPMKTLLYRWPEHTAVPNLLHWLWIDPENHGKHIQTVWAPFVGNTENNGLTLGGSLALLNLTPEGIMTGLFQLRALYNETFGTTFALEMVSCPAAYFNYWLSSEISTNGEDKQIHFHMENLTIGSDDRFGYEIQLDVFKDPRYRFYGLGAATKEEDKTVYTHSESGVVLDLYWLPVDHLRFAIGGKYRSVAVNDAAADFRGNTTFTTSLTSTGGKFARVPGIKGATIAGERVSVVYDHRNSEFLPTDGFYGKITGEYNQVIHQVKTSPEQVDNYGRLLVDLRQYFSTVDQRITFLIRNSWTFTTSRNIPFFDQATIGGDFSDRAFDRGRFFGQHMGFLSMEFRYQAFHMDMLGTPWTIELAPFLDMSQIFNDNSIKGRFNINPGMSMRMLNKPNVGMVGNIAYGQDGIILTGGVQLPF